MAPEKTSIQMKFACGCLVACLLTHHDKIINNKLVKGLSLNPYFEMFIETSNKATVALVFLIEQPSPAVPLFTFLRIQASFVLTLKVERTIDSLSYTGVLQNHEGFI